MSDKSDKCRIRFAYSLNEENESVNINFEGVKERLQIELSKIKTGRYRIIK
jgi:hypothetical protein